MKKIFILCFILGSFGAFSEQGGWAGGGGDLVSQDSGSAWFLKNGESSNKVINVCFEQGSEFDLDLTDARNIFKKSFEKWNAYIQNHGVDPLVSHYKDSGECVDGEKYDLTVYFGGSNSRILSGIKNMGLHNPVAFAYRESYDIYKGWGKGLIWIKEKRPLASWIQSMKKAQVSLAAWDFSRLESLLTHEIGHIFGVSHIPGTIMDSSLARQLTEDKKVITSIDGYNKLLFNEEKPFESTVGLIHPVERVTREIVKKLTGKELNGKIFPKLNTIQGDHGPFSMKQTINWVSTKNDHLLKIELSFPYSQDSENIYTPNTWGSSVSIFKQFYKVRNSEPTCNDNGMCAVQVPLIYAYHFNKSTSIGTAKIKGKVYTAVKTYNGGGSWFPVQAGDSVNQDKFLKALPEIFILEPNGQRTRIFGGSAYGKQIDYN